ncbi:MAG: gamma-glutamyltransferase [Candidatus Aminicenantes bacterium RBG_16_63_16]|nr:MAG: gamma-glutamyltransferase [Candidatus Aminicenantes bacterium RBG_16_63_16]
MKARRPVTAAILAMILAAAASSAAPQMPKTVAAKHGLVVSSERQASEVGLSILKTGGNAVDAAVATAFALAVTYPGAGNIGGGGFLVLYTKDDRVTTLDFREKAPLAASPGMFLDEQGEIRDDANHQGILSAGVPGSVAGLELAHKKYGKLPWKDVLQPAVQVADQGFPVSLYFSKNLETTYMAKFLRHPSTARVFLKPDGTVYQPGELWRQPDLAATLKRIQTKGAADFYRGATAKLIVEFMKKSGGLITAEDLAKYEAVERKPLHGTYRGFDVYAMGPPSSGGIVLLEMLNILEGYNLSGLGHDSAPYLHLLTEAMRSAYLDRARYLGDPEANPAMPVNRLISKEYAERLRSAIPLDNARRSRVEDIEPPAENPYTTHLSVMDKEGNAVSLTTTIESWYGSGIVVEGAGFLLNNEMGDFNPVPGKTDDRGQIGTKANVIAPEKRMLSNMSPTIIAKDGKPFLLIGCPGGRAIPNAVLQVILNVVDFRMDIAGAIARPRIHHQWLPDVTEYEPSVFSADALKLYKMLGHKAREDEGLKHNDAMGIMIDLKTGKLAGCADPRSEDGSAAGY